MLLKIAELETAVEGERLNVSKLNKDCESLRNDALLAREEFEKEFKCHLQLETTLAAVEEDFGKNLFFVLLPFCIQKFTLSFLLAQFFLKFKFFYFQLVCINCLLLFYSEN